MMEDETIGKILGIRDEISSMGGNDYEMPALEDILERLRDKKLKPEEALKEAMEIRARKVDYH